jgi:hypothetical protein
MTTALPTNKNGCNDEYDEEEAKDRGNDSY